MTHAALVTESTARLKRARSSQHRQFLSVCSAPIRRKKEWTKLQLISGLRLPRKSEGMQFGSRRARSHDEARSHRIECRENGLFARTNQSRKRVIEMSPVIFRTLHQAKRVLRIVVGFTLLLIGVVLLVGPGPGWLVILLGLGLLAAEFVWARRLLDSMKEKAVRLRKFVFSRST